MENVSLLFQKYQKGILSYDCFKEQVALYVYQIIRQKCFYDEDKQSELFCCLYERIDTIIEKYKPTVSPFETYIRTIVFYSKKNYLRKTGTLNIRGYLFKKPEFSPYKIEGTDIITDTEEEYQTNTSKIDIIKNICQNRPKAQKNFFIILLKNIYYFDESLLDQYAANSCYTKKQYIEIKKELLPYLEKKREILLDRIYKRNVYFLTALVLKERIKIYQNISDIEKTKERILQLNRLVLKINHQIRKYRIAPSNRFLSTLLQVPKGTIDSTLHNLKKLLYQYEKIE